MINPQPILSRRFGRKRSRKRPPVAVRPNRTVARYYGTGIESTAKTSRGSIGSRLVWDC
jgi:hypothetical protein